MGTQKSISDLLILFTCSNMNINEHAAKITPINTAKTIWTHNTSNTLYVYAADWSFFLFFPAINIINIPKNKMMPNTATATRNALLAS